MYILHLQMFAVMLRAPIIAAALTVDADSGSTLIDR